MLAASPYGWQMHLYDKARPELSDRFLKPLFALTERYRGKVLLGEISGDRALERMAEYTEGGGGRHGLQLRPPLLPAGTRPASAA